MNTNLEKIIQAMKEDSNFHQVLRFYLQIPWHIFQVQKTRRAEWAHLHQKGIVGGPDNTAE